MRRFAGVACPVVVMDLGSDAVDGLSQLDRVVQQSPAARVLVLDPGSVEGVGELARELGATHVISGFVPPPEVASLIDRWITLAAAQSERRGLGATGLHRDAPRRRGLARGRAWGLNAYPRRAGPFEAPTIQFLSDTWTSVAAGRVALAIRNHARCSGKPIPRSRNVMYLMP